MKRNRIWLLLMISPLILSLVACTPASPSGGIPSTPTGETSTPTVEVIPQISYEISTKPESRQQDITLIIKDQYGNPLPNVEVSFEQKDIDFMFASHDTDGILYAVSEDNYDPALLRELGLNTTDDWPYYFWNLAEPSNNEFVFDDNTNDWGGMKNRAIWESLEEIYPELRFRYLQLGPYFAYNYPDNIPSWVNFADIDGDFKDEYEEFLRAYVDRFQGQVNFYSVGTEVNQTGNEFSGKSMDWWVDWINWECGIIKEIDPQARIMISLAPIYDINIGYSAQFGHREFIEALIAAGVDFDIIGVEYQPFTVCPSDWCFDDINELSSYGKEIFIWELYYPSANDANASCEQSYGWHSMYYPQGGFTEEWQAEQIVNFMENMIENPLVIGIDYYTWEDGTAGWANSQTTGLLRNDNVEDEHSIPKPSYYALKDYWHSLFISGGATTDQDGKITLNAIPGLFKITVNGQTEIIHISE